MRATVNLGKIDGSVILVQSGLELPSLLSSARWVRV